MIEYCSLASGSCGNSHYIKTPEWDILVDVGMSAKYIREALQQIGESMEAIDAVFVTHEHSDHVRGLAVLAKGFDFKIFMAREIYAHLSDRLSHIPLERFEFIDPGEFEWGDLTIEVFPLSHDAQAIYGYAFSQDQKKLGIATDSGYMNGEAREALWDADFLVIEANHDEHLVEAGRYPYALKQRILSDRGHLSNTMAAEFIAELFHENRRLKYCVLAHLSEENNYPELAYKSVEKVLARHEIELGKDLMISVAQRRQISERFRII